MPTEVPAEVARFVDDHIGSVAQLEILLFLRDRSGTEIAPDAVARELRIEPRWVAAELGELARRARRRDAGVVVPDVDLSLVRSLTALVGLSLLLYGLVWEVRR